MNKRSTIFGVFWFLILTACAPYKVPNSPITGPYENATVGILVDVADTPKHTHIGTTIFNNFEKEFPYSWNIKQEIFETFRQHIESRTNLNVIDLTAMKDELTAENNQLVVIENDNWAINQESIELRDQLMSKGINVLIRIIEGPTLARLECSNYGCNERYSEGQGVFSRSFMGAKWYFASASYLISVESLDPVVDISMLPALREALSYEELNKPIKTFKPNQLKAITEKEMLIVKEHILEFINGIAELTTNYLNGYQDPVKN